MPTIAAESDDQPTIFRGLPPEEVEQLFKRATLRRMAAGEIIFGQGDPPGNVYLVRSGAVKLSLLSEEGQETVLSLAQPGDVIGEMAALDGQPRSASAIVVESGELGSVTRQAFLEYLQSSAPACFRMLRLLVARLRSTDEHVADLIFADLHARVARKLLRLSSRAPGTIQLTQEELAQMAGSSRQRVNQVLRYYQDQGYVSLAPHRITVLDVDGLFAEALL